MLVLSLCATRAPAAELFVSPTGNDADPGTRDQPLSTVAGAQRAVRAHAARGKEPITVRFDAGIYYLPEPVVFTADDSGSASAPVVYSAAADGAEVVLSGGEPLRDLTWTARDRSDGKIFETPVAPGLKTDQLFVNGQRQILARYPNFNPNERIFNGYAADAISAERAKRWANPAGGIIKTMHRHEWGDYSYVITGVDEAGNLKYDGGWQNNRQLGMHPRYRMVEGIAEELDAPGEWFLDEKTATLHFYPPEGMSAADLANAAIEFVRLRGLFEFKGTEAAPVKSVSLKGFTFRHTARTFMDNREPLLRSDWTAYRGGAVLFNGAEDCALDDCFIDQVGGNAVFVNNYNRRVAIRGCHMANAGANGVAFVGDPAAVRNPLFEYNQRHDYAKIDRTPGPRTSNYPAECLVEECLIYLSGRTEKQTAPVQIAMAQSITVRRCSIYDVPRAGINIGDGTWGGHVVEFCDIFDTVKETGDHGSFNSWGRDRFWDKDIPTVDAAVAQDEKLPLLDVVSPIVLRNNRWRCDHGWDVDLDDGSSNYEITNNLCLNGGIKFREGYHRTATNNVLVRNSFHPHVWFKNSGDVFARNVVMTPYRPIGMPPEWGREIDHNLLPDERALEASRRAGRDAHSAAGDPMFIDPANGDFRVKDDSPALKVGFKNFPMDQFGVTRPALKRIARTPSFEPSRERRGPRANDRTVDWLGAKAKNVTTEGERSAAGLPGVEGILVLDVPAGSPAYRAGLRRTDVILECNGQPVKTFAELQTVTGPTPPGTKVKLGVTRNQQITVIEIEPPAQ